MEEWKQYRDTNYEVSNLGNIRNKETKKMKKQFQKNNGKLKNDYMRVSMYIEGKDRTISVHRIVAECFLPNFDEKLEVNHKNSIRYDNRACNLEMTTKEQNYQHSIQYGNGSRRKAVVGTNQEGEKKEFKSLWEAARFVEKTGKTGIVNIDHICNNIKNSIKGKCINSYGYKWEWLV